MFKNKLVISLFLFAVGGCGVHVGNGLRKYSSPHGFEVQYNESLTVIESSDKKTVTITDNKNASRARANDEAYSYAQFAVRTERAGSTAQLKQLAAVENTARSFEEVTLNGSIAVKSVRDTSTGLNAVYYFTTTSQAVVRLDVNASAKAKALFAPIGESYRGGGQSNLVGHHHHLVREVPMALAEAVEINFKDGGAMPEVVALPAAEARLEPGTVARRYVFKSGLAVRAELVNHRPEFWTMVAEDAKTNVLSSAERSILVLSEEQERGGKKVPLKTILARASNRFDLHVSINDGLNSEEGQLDYFRFVQALHFKQSVTEGKMDDLVRRLKEQHREEPVLLGEWLHLMRLRRN